MMRRERLLALPRPPRLKRCLHWCLSLVLLIVVTWFAALSWVVLDKVRHQQNTNVGFSILDYSFEYRSTAEPSKPSARENDEPVSEILSPLMEEIQVEESGQRKTPSSSRRPPGSRGNGTKAKPRRIPLLPIWLPNLVNQLRNSSTVIFEQLKTQHPDEQDEVLRTRAEFGSLAVCNPYNAWYVCKDNPTCVASDMCSHREKDDVAFHEMHTVALRHYKERDERLKLLQKVLDRMYMEMGRSKDDRLVFLMTLNSGFSFLFANWLCSLAAQGVDIEAVKKRTLLLPRDADARRFVSSLGFFAPTADEMNILEHWTGTHPVSRKAAPLFGQGDHNIINLFFKFGMPLDMLTLGYSVVNQDVDFVWFRDPVPEMIRLCEEANCHGIFIKEGRDFFGGQDREKGTYRPHTKPLPELNTGLYMLKHHPETIHFLEVLIQGAFLQQWRRRDQLYYNTVMWHDHFAHMRWVALSDEYYVPGKRLHSSDLAARPLADKSKLVVLHVSDTSNYRSKIDRLKTIDQWYFTMKLCAAPVKQCHAIPTCWTSVSTCTDCGL
jgi:hypothetical protein